MVNGALSDKNGLFNQFNEDLIVPFVFIKRDSVMTKEQAMYVFRDLVTAAKIKIPPLVVFIVVGLLFVICGGCIHRKLSQEAIDGSQHNSLEKKNLIDEITY